MEAIKASHTPAILSNVLLLPNLRLLQLHLLASIFGDYLGFIVMIMYIPSFLLFSKIKLCEH